MNSNKNADTIIRKKQSALFLTGLIALILGISVLGFYGVRKIAREYQKQKLMRDNPVVEIADLNIKEYFNNLKNIKIGMKVVLYDKDKKSYTYIVTDSFIVEPNETWVLDDFGDNRVTIITCTVDGTQRQIVVGILK